MINIGLCSIKRAIAHRIRAKKATEEYATAEFSERIIEFRTGNMTESQDVIKSRINKAVGNQSYSFRFTISETAEGSVYHELLSISSNNSDENFIAVSKHLATLAAENQKRSDIKDGYLMLFQLTDPISITKPIFLIIKAEPHDAMKLEELDGHNYLEVLKDIILSPEQKLFKIGLFYDKSFDSEFELSQVPDNDLSFSAVYSDLQYSKTSGKPAEYFYKDFLGLDDEECGKIQTKIFFEKTEKFIQTNFTSPTQKYEAISALRTTVRSHSTTIDTRQFMVDVIPNTGNLRDVFLRTIINPLPAIIRKDTSMIKSRLKTRNLLFNQIKISGPEELFADDVEILTTETEDINLNDSSYTYIRIKGTPAITDNNHAS